MSVSPVLSISIVSHAQGELVRPLLVQLAGWQGCRIELLLTLNLPEDEGFIEAASGVPTRVLRNLAPRGFGANHNRAFEVAAGEYFLVLNPDIRAEALDLRPLIDALGRGECGVVGASILDIQGQPTDSPRRFPTVPRLLRRLLTGIRTPEYGSLRAPVAVEWVGGMFMLFHRDTYRALGGFDERFFMYMEDVDICRRIRDQDLQVMFQPLTTVVHDARRQNRRSARHMRWHVRSLLRYLFLYRLGRRWPFDING